MLANDTDVDGNPLAVTQFTIGGVTYPSGTSAVLPEGTLVIAANGTFSFAPAANYNGPVPTVTYTISDGNGGSASATLNLGPVTPVNDAPVGQGQTVSVIVGETVSGAIPASDADDDTLTFSLVQLPVLGSVIINSDGTFVYVPANNSGGINSFVVMVADGHGGFLPVTITVRVAAAEIDTVMQLPENQVPFAPDSTPTVNYPPIIIDGVVLDSVAGYGRHSFHFVRLECQSPGGIGHQRPE